MRPAQGGNLTRPPRVRLYTRPRCGLCDEAREVIEQVRRRPEFEFELEEISIQGDDALELEYGIRIPVIEVDGQEIAELRLDPEELVAALAPL